MKITPCFLQIADNWLVVTIYKTPTGPCASIYLTKMPDVWEKSWFKNLRNYRGNANKILEDRSQIVRPMWDPMVMQKNRYWRKKRRKTGHENRACQCSRHDESTSGNQNGTATCKEEKSKPRLAMRLTIIVRPYLSLLPNESYRNAHILLIMMKLCYNGIW